MCVARHAAGHGEAPEWLGVAVDDRGSAGRKRSPEARYVAASVGRTESRLHAHAANDGLFDRVGLVVVTRGLAAGRLRHTHPSQRQGTLNRRPRAFAGLWRRSAIAHHVPALLVRSAGATSFVPPGACRLLQGVSTAAQ
ncbi:hypothetical protein OPT61_g7996 [Boeremia exigua]|uniref:Uncharacterized protein n=1 Tax=Boeremia exigua TaxID=749465 RepID=A0ACC2I103_9PLEO|nr:hypothetical protein OPT61_g7996 [Boeremia exigua]